MHEPANFLQSAYNMEIMLMWCTLLQQPTDDDDQKPVLNPETFQNLPNFYYSIIRLVQQWPKTYTLNLSTISKTIEGNFITFFWEL